MNTRVKASELTVEADQKTVCTVLVALGMQAPMPGAITVDPASRWVASWRFCPN